MRCRKIYRNARRRLRIFLPLLARRLTRRRALAPAAATRKRGAAITAFAFIVLTPGDEHNFAGKLSSDLLTPAHGHKLLPGLQVTVSLVNHPSKKQISISVRSVLQDGLIIN